MTHFSVLMKEFQFVFCVGNVNGSSYLNFSIRPTTAVPFVLFFINLTPAVGKGFLCIEINCTVFILLRFYIDIIMHHLGCTRNQDFMFVVLVQEGC